MTEFQMMIKELCDERNIEMELLSKDWIIKLKKDNKNKYIMGYKFPLDNRSMAACCDDKYATYKLLESVGIPVIEHKLIYDPKRKTQYESDLKTYGEIKKYLKEHRKLVVKNTNGFSGKNVFLTRNMFEVKYALRKVFKTNWTAVISPFMNIDAEYRAICLDGNVEVIFEKVRSKDSWKHNLSQGACARLVEDESIKKIVTEIALKSMKAIDGRFASVDVIKVDKEYMVIEINAGVCMNKFMEQVPGGRIIGRNIFGKAMDKIFE